LGEHCTNIHYAEFKTDVANRHQVSVMNKANINSFVDYAEKKIQTPFTFNNFPI